LPSFIEIQSTTIFMRLLLAFRTFFSVLFRREVADRVRLCLEKPKAEPAIVNPALPEVTTKPTLKSKPSSRNEAITLLSTLQREARLLDLVGESLDQYNDAQIGAAARDVLRDTKKALNRMFGIQPLLSALEGDKVEFPEQPSPVRWRIIGQESLKRGTLNHPGWIATKVDMPQWSGNADDAMVIAAAEVET
jgi:hypothetical protein